MNVCTSCGFDFTGVRDFDSHRVGTHAYTYSEGARMDPPREDGRRCLTDDEMIAGRWRINRHGRWSHPRRPPVGGVTVPAERVGSARAA